MYVFMYVNICEVSRNILMDIPTAISSIYALTYSVYNALIYLDHLVCAYDKCYLLERMYLYFIN